MKKGKSNYICGCAIFENNVYMCPYKGKECEFQYAMKNGFYFQFLCNDEEGYLFG
jgi:hypothetical protein